MSKGWRIIGTLILVLVLLGGICIGVGFMTGGDVVEIYAGLNSKYNLSGYWESWSQYAVNCFWIVVEAVRGLW